MFISQRCFLHRSFLSELHPTFREVSASQRNGHVQTLASLPTPPVLREIDSHCYSFIVITIMLGYFKLPLIKNDISQRVKTELICKH